MSELAIIWADDVVEIAGDPASKAILCKLASVTDAAECGWMTVALLAQRVGVSERTIQIRLRRLTRPRGEMVKGDPAPGLGLLRETGRTHRNGTRSIPYYELLVDYDAVIEVVRKRKEGAALAAMARSRMGAAVCTHRPAPNDAVCTPMGAAVCTPNEDNREEVDADASTAGASAQAAVREIVDLWPPEALWATDMAAAAEAIHQAVEELGDPAPLIRAVKAFLADWSRHKHDYAPPALDRWMAKGNWRPMALRLRDHAAADAAAAPAMPAPQGPPELIAAVTAHEGPGFAATWLGRAAWDDETRTLLVSNAAFQKLRLIWTDPAIAALNITLKDRTS